MKNKEYRKKKGIHEIDKCYLCNNKAQNKCNYCGQKICNNCNSKINNKRCYKCDVIEVP